jgi:hypothetical protein
MAVRILQDRCSMTINSRFLHQGQYSGNFTIPISGALAKADAVGVAARYSAFRETLLYRGGVVSSSFITEPSLHKNGCTISRGSRFSPRSALGPPHNGVRRRRRNNLNIVLPKRNRVPCERASSIVPARGAPPPKRNSGSVLHAASASLRQRNSVPSIHIRCRMTARRRASATIAFLASRR